MKKSRERLDGGTGQGAGPGGKPQNVDSAGTQRVLATDDRAARGRQLRQPNERDESADAAVKHARAESSSRRMTICRAGSRTPMRATAWLKCCRAYPRRRENFDESDPIDTAPLSKKKTSA